MKDFFISYNQADLTWAEWIAWNLEAAGYTTVLQAWDFRPGSNFVLEMHRVTTEAERTIAVLSPDYLTSAFTQPEWAAAFAQDSKGEQAALVPVRVGECELKGLLRQIVFIDLVGLNQTAAREALLAGISRERPKPTTAPDFPGTAATSLPKRPPFPPSIPAPGQTTTVDREQRIEITDQMRRRATDGEAFHSFRTEIPNTQSEPMNQSTGRDEYVNSARKVDEQGTRVKLRQILTNQFSENELRELAFDLGIDFEQLPGEGKGRRVVELIMWFERREQLWQLREAAHQRRPNADWN